MMPSIAILVAALCAYLLGIRVQRRRASTLLQPYVAELTSAAGSPACAVCGMPANPVRFHDGRHLCRSHKARPKVTK